MFRLGQSRLARMAVVAILACCETCFAQGKSANPDPEIAAITKAMDDARLEDADKLLSTAIQSAERDSPTSARMSSLLSLLVDLRFRQGKIPECISITRKQMAMDSEISGPQSLRVIDEFIRIGTFYGAIGDSANAEQTLEQVLPIARQNPGPHSGALLLALRKLVALYAQNNRLPDAQKMLDEEIETCRNQPPDSVSSQCSTITGQQSLIARYEGNAGAAEGMLRDSVLREPGSGRAWRIKLANLQRLARQYEKDGSFELAESAYRDQIELIEKNSDAQHPALPIPQYISLSNVLSKEGRRTEAADVLRQALEIQEKATTQSRGFAHFFPTNRLIAAYRADGRLSEVEPVLRQWLSVQERALGSGNVAVAETLDEIARVYVEEGDFAEAEPLCRRSIEVQEANLGPDDPHLVGTLQTYSQVLRGMGNEKEARAVSARIEALQKRVTGAMRPPKQAAP